MKHLNILLLTVLISITSMGQTDTDLQSPRLFAPDIISTSLQEFNASFTPDGKRLFFSRATVGWGYIAIYTSELKQGKWTTPKEVSFTGIYRDTDPFVSSDGSKLYFMSDRPVNGNAFKDFVYSFFYVELKNGVPNSEPVPVKIPLPEGLNGLYPSISKNGNIYFHARSNQTADIYVSRLNNNSYQTPEKLSFNTNEYNDYDAIISKDESFVIFVSSNRKGQGGSDLWISYQEENNQWSEPINLGKTINSAGNEGAPGLSPDNKTLFFSGTREIIQRDEWIRTGTKPSPSTILNTYKNGLMNIYQVSITDFLKQK